MEDKICVDVFIPSVNKNYDIVLSPELYTKEAAEYIFKAIGEYESFGAEPQGLILCDRSKKCILNGELPLSKCGVNNGSRLMVV
ncbi:MAG: hypothetical protein LUC97_04040 [Clostridiales bacterium]|nr:hypothetical protein [Clostridiales bacterium]MCD8214802.1 hypothetical protein [Clostridiales bacterium]